MSRSGIAAVNRRFEDAAREGDPQQLGLEDVRLETVDLEIAGDMASEVGEARLSIASGSAVVEFAVVCEKLDGQWRLDRDIWNAGAA